MEYLIDGYNFLFWKKTAARKEETNSLRSDREALVHEFISYKALHTFSCSLVFDAHFTKEELVVFIRQSPLDILFTPKGVTADEYILETLYGAGQEKRYCVVTQDKGLQKKVAQEGFPFLGFRAFLSLLKKKASKKREEKKGSDRFRHRDQVYIDTFEKRFRIETEQEAL